MQCSLITLWTLFIAAANAGTLVLETDGPVNVQFGETTIARASEPGSLNIGELPEGPITLRLVRSGKATIDTEVNVPRTGTTTLKLAGDTLHVAGKLAPVRQLNDPVLVIKPAHEQRFTVVINGQDRRLVSKETVLDDLEAGTHTVEFRSEDQTLVWVRGTLELTPGAAVSLFIEEGRMVTAGGTPNAWNPAKGR